MATKLLSIILLIGACHAQTIRTIKALVKTQQSGISLVDDTFRASAWSDSTSGGIFNGGRLFVPINDGNCTPGQGRNFCLFEVTAFNSVTGINTLVLTNYMSGYGVAASAAFDSASNSWKTGDPWFYLNVFYVPICTQDNNSPYNVHQCGLIMSPDFGVHWCNYLSYTTGLPNGVGSSGTPNTCTSANWSATGDVVTSQAGLQWPGVGGSPATYLNPNGRWGLVAVCQDNSQNCPTVPGIDTSTYIYIVSANNNGADNWIHRYTKSATAAGSPMLPANWEHWDGSTWVSNYATLSTSVGDVGVRGNGPIWIPSQQAFISFGGTATSLQYVWSTSLFTVGWNYGLEVDCRVSGTCSGGAATGVLATLVEDSIHGTSLWVSSDDTAAPGNQHGYFTLVQVNTSNARGGVQ